MSTKNTNEVAGRNELFSAMSGGKPHKTYVKKILGKVYVTVWDVFTNQPVGMILEGDPRRNDQTAMIDIWSEKEDVFFRRMNRRHLADGTVVEYKRPDEGPRERTMEEWSDEELIALINKPFLALKAAVNKTESEALLFRMESLSEQMDKPESYMKLIRAKLSEIQKEPEQPSSVEEG